MIDHDIAAIFPGHGEIWGYCTDTVQDMLGGHWTLSGFEKSALPSPCQSSHFFSHFALVQDHKHLYHLGLTLSGNRSVRPQRFNREAQHAPRASRLTDTFSWPLKNINSWTGPTICGTIWPAAQMSLQLGWRQRTDDYWLQPKRVNQISSKWFEANLHKISLPGKTFGSGVSKHMVFTSASSGLSFLISNLQYVL